MPPIFHLQRRDSSRSVSGGISDGVVFLVGITILCIFIFGLLASVGYYYLKKRATGLSQMSNEPSQEREKQDVLPSFSRTRITSSIIMPKPAAKHKMFTTRCGSGVYLDGSITPEAENVEIIQRRKADNEVPVPCSTFFENFGSDPSVPDAPIIEKPAPSLQDLHRHSADSKPLISVSSGRRHPSFLDLSQIPTLHCIQSPMDVPSTRASLHSSSVAHQPSISPSHRNSLLDPPHSGNHPRTFSVATTHTAPISSLNALSAAHKTALQPFQRLLPDELDVRVGDKLSLLQTFDDGWCVCVAGNPLGSTCNNEDFMMGCVPLWVFERVPKGQGDIPRMREVRTTSLSVTTENKPTLAPLDRASGVSWSIF